MLPLEGGTRELTLELTTNGTAITGTVLGAPIREGQVDANTVVLKVANPEWR